MPSYYQLPITCTLILYTVDFYDAIKQLLRDIEITENFYVNQLGFKTIGKYDDYLIVGIATLELHFFSFKTLNPKENYVGVYNRTSGIDNLYDSLLDTKTSIHPNGKLGLKP